ncbi:MAG: S8 family serine peptidase [Elusimicrobia bacterium]|nr:S8 family serine peptidase [Elusimicrobiota bacterium]
MKRAACLAALLALSRGGLAASFADRVKVLDAKGAVRGEALSDRLIVRFREGLDAAQRNSVHQAVGTTELRSLGAPGLFEVSVGIGADVRQVLRLIQARPEVSQADYVFSHHLDLTSNDPLAPQQYSLSQMDAFGAWEFEVGTSNNVTIAVLDSGVDDSHPDFAGKIDTANRKDFCPPAQPGCSGVCGAAFSDDFGHGTRVAGVAAASGNNGLGIAGISWGARILPIKVIDNTGCSDDATLVAALNYVAGLEPGLGKAVINMSLGGVESPCNAALITAVDNALAKDVVVVAAAGNYDFLDNPGKVVECPAKIPGVIAAGATDSSNNIAVFSAVGPEMATNGVVAPGVDILSTMIGGGYGTESGTSFSAPNVSGVAALVRAAKPAKTPTDVFNIIRGSADSIGVASAGAGAGLRPAGSSSGAGRVNAFRAMRLAVNGTAAFDGDQKAIAYPNPFRTSQTGAVSFSIPTSLQGANAAIKIYTIGGEYVRTVTGLTWDGRNAAGSPVVTGTYIFVVSTDNGTTRGRVAVIR